MGSLSPISWEEAIETITNHWKKLIQDEGPESILPYSFYGNMGNLTAEGMDRRFFNYLGSSQLDRTICSLQEPLAIITQWVEAMGQIQKI